MPKKIAVINDLSSFGRCSLVAAISVLSSMGLQPCPLPTAILSAQSEYPSYYLDDYTDKMDYFRTEWAKMKQQFYGIYTGYIANEAQFTHIFQFLDTFKDSSTFLLVDPVMGDDGITYDMFTQDLLLQMKKLVMQADILTPNLTEFCLLTNHDYQELTSISNSEELLHTIKSIGKSYLQEFDHPLDIVITGIHTTDSQGNAQISNLHLSDSDISCHSFAKIGGSYSGTGDLFASCLCGGIARGDQISDTIQLAGAFLSHALKSSIEEEIPLNDGVNYEQFLYLLAGK